ncbi:hypothetical protein O3P69_006917 [Scylla paramamosain]|uniref:ABC transporter domain-containing protein n=1 Tax=Scylla paramamosain TaxID=85552 RepID=A0AAW0U3N8_SCYPA
METEMGYLDEARETEPLLPSKSFGKFKSPRSVSFKREGYGLSPRKLNDYGTPSTCRGEENITLTWRDLSVYVAQKKTRFFKFLNRDQPLKKVICNVSGVIESGTLTAVMGASGAGKSSLLSALAHGSGGGLVVDGQVCINGHKMSNAKSSGFSYLRQNDLFLGTMTAKEHLTFMAQLKMDRHTTQEQRDAKVKELLRDMGLTEAQNTRIGIPGSDKSLSGGERKRLAFAAEIVTSPPLLFCDEPTTGLDFFSAKKFMDIMKDMAAQGKTIMCTIHQPSSELFSIFDRLLLLAEGRLAYMGSSLGAMYFFESLGYKCPVTFNPADFYINTLAVLPGSETTSFERIERICNSYAKSVYCRDVKVTIGLQDNLQTRNTESGGNHVEQLFFRNVPEKPGWCTEFRWLLWRSLLNSYRNPAIHYTRLGRNVTVALVVGLTFFNVPLTQAGIQDIQGAFFVIVMQSCNAALMSIMYVLPQEMPVFLREYKDGTYHSSAYYISKTLSLIPGYIIETVLLCFICYWMVGFHFSFIIMVLIFICTTNTASACGLMVSTLFGNFGTSMAVLMLINISLFATSGIFSDINSLPWFIGWLKYLSWYRYGVEVLTVIQWSGITNITCEMPPGVPCITTGEEVIRKYSFRPSYVASDFALVVLICCCLHLLSFTALHLRAKLS